MRQHFPSWTELLELGALGAMVLALQWFIGSWAWSVFFVMGFVWNWSVLNGWVHGQVRQRQYRFSMMRGIAKFHELLLGPFGRYPRVRRVLAVLPAGLAIGVVCLVFQSNVPWWAAFLGSTAFFLVRRQLAELVQKSR